MQETLARRVIGIRIPAIESAFFRLAYDVLWTSSSVCDAPIQPTDFVGMLRNFRSTGHIELLIPNFSGVSLFKPLMKTRPVARIPAAAPTPAAAAVSKDDTDPNLTIDERFKRDNAFCKALQHTKLGPLIREATKGGNKFPTDSQGRERCLTYHVWKKCNKKCHRWYDHNPLPDQRAKDEVYKFVKEMFPEHSDS